LISNLPVKGYPCQREHTRRHCDIGHKIVDSAIGAAKMPFPKKRYTNKLAKFKFTKINNNNSEEKTEISNYR